MPDITCKAIFVAHLPLGFVILLWDVHGAGLGNHFFKVLMSQTPSPAPGVRHVSPPRDSWSRSKRWEGAGGTLFPENHPALGISCGRFSRPSPLRRLEAQPLSATVPHSRRRQQGRERPAAHPRPGAPPPQVPARARMLDSIPTLGPSFP